MNLPASPVKRTWNLKTIGLGLVLAAVFLLTVADSCNYQTAEDWLSGEPEACACQGPDLKCSDSNKTESFPNSKYCDPQKLVDLGLCSCQGADLTCVYYVNASYASTPSKSTATYSYATLPPPTGTPASGEHVTTKFANSSLCVSGTLVTEVSTQSVTDTPMPTDTPTPSKGGSGSKPTDTPVPPVVCAAGWLPAAGCTCCGTTLVCADGTVAQFNPQCGVGGGSKCTCVPNDPACNPTPGMVCASHCKENGSACTP